MALPATWELTLDAPLDADAAGSAAAIGERSTRMDIRRALSATPQPPNTGNSCNASNGKPLGGEWVVGNLCPANCKNTGTFTDINQVTYSSCQPIVFYSWDTAAPFCDYGGPPWVQLPQSANPAVYNEFLLNYGPGALCAKYRVPAPPVLISNAANALNLMPCTVSGNTLSCIKPQVKPGLVKVLADTKAPSTAFLGIRDQPADGDAPRTVTLDLQGQGTMRYVITGADDRRMASAELWEIELDFEPGPSGAQAKLTHVLRATLTDDDLPDPKQWRSISTAANSVPFNATDRFKRYFFARVFDAAGNSTDSEIIPVTRVTPVLDVPTFSANPLTLPPPSGNSTLSWTVANALSVSIDQGVGDVTALTSNGMGSVQVAVNGTRTFTLTATGINNSTATRTVTVTVAPDTQAPTVTLAASPGTVTAPGSTVLSANATDNVGVTAVEFYRGSTLIGTDTTPGDGFTQSVAFTSVDVGNQSFTARAVDAVGNAATSAAAVVLVTVPVSADRYVSPSGSDANPGTQAQPYRTLTHAFANIGSGATVWLENGTYTWAAEATAGASQLDFKTRNFPSGRTLRAISPGQATLNMGLSIAGDATIVGVAFTSVPGDGPGSGGSTLWVRSNATPNATVAFKGLRFGAVVAGGGDGWGAVVRNDCDTCSVTLDTNGVAGFNYLGTDYPDNVRFITNLGGPVTINGGVIGTPTLATVNGGCSTAVFTGHRTSFNGVTLTLPGTTVDNAPAFCLLGSEPVTLANSTVTQQGSGRNVLFLLGFGISGIPGTGHLVLNNSTVSAPSSGLLVGLRLAGVRFTSTGSTLSGGSRTIARVGVEAITNSALTLTDTTVQNVNGTAIELDSAGGATVTLNGGEIKNVQGAALRLTSGSFNTRLRNVVISNTGISQGDGAIALFGDAASVYDLGTAAQPGGNTILGNNASRPGLRVGAASGVTVNAVGNTWVGGQQGASAGGTYSGNLLVTSGSGTNYSVTSGALRLSQ